MGRDPKWDRIAIFWGCEIFLVLNSKSEEFETSAEVMTFFFFFSLHSENFGLCYVGVAIFHTLQKGVAAQKV